MAHAVSKTRLKFSNSKIAYKNTLNNFLYFFSTKVDKKNNNFIVIWTIFEEIMSEKPKFDIFI